MPNSDSNWFKDWFNTPYYHALYAHRNEEEAQAFVTRLVQAMELTPNALVADIACGKGRHTRTLDQLGMQALGFDLSHESIAFASRESERLGLQAKFFVHDMRDAYSGLKWKAAFNLFTSFGYFQNRKTDALVLQHIYEQLEPGAWFVQDYLNAASVLPSLPLKEVIERPSLEFHCHKFLEKGVIVKDIQVIEKGQEQGQFQERVEVYTAQELQGLHEAAGFQVQAIWGNYHGEAYSAQSSPRIIFLSQKMS
ncbi:MAG: class I SAM-dependent methyltransferase [Bacteroidetes bacterium]|nr:class I SAM-dependent methyltransferase [Bacteroidota bacterium]MDA0943499.1 class I SAM-dependent methyltransferase [Bacteroidota bacterium]MDA1112122.1 class I SAM-dependent methyltransferase [Bacteroidota bacterium]